MLAQVWAKTWQHVKGLAGHVPTWSGPSCPAGLSLAKLAGLQQSDLVEVIKLGAIACPMFALKVRAAACGGCSRVYASALCLHTRASAPNRSNCITASDCGAQGPSMIEGNYPPAFPLKHQQKDMR